MFARYICKGFLQQKCKRMPVISLVPPFEGLFGGMFGGTSGRISQAHSLGLRGYLQGHILGVRLPSPCEFVLLFAFLFVRAQRAVFKEQTAAAPRLGWA